MNNADPGWFDVQQLFHLARGERGDRDDQVGTLGGGAGLRGEACPEIGSGVVTRNHEQVVKSAYAAPVTGGAETLVQSMKKVRGWCAVFP